MVIGGRVRQEVNGSWIYWTDGIEIMSPDLTTMPVPNHLSAMNPFPPGTREGGAGAALAPGGT